MRRFDPECELCEAAPLTERFYDDDECWIAECESCWVPMIVWRAHDHDPPHEVKAMLHERLRTVVAEHFVGEVWIDDNLRSIPTHYHAHARSRHGPLGMGLERRVRETAADRSSAKDPDDPAIDPAATP